MPDILDEDLPEPELSKRDQRRAERTARKTARWQNRAAVREQEQRRRRRAFNQQRSPIVLAVLAVLVFGGIAVVGALVPRGDDAGGDVKVLHQDTEPTTVTTDAGATSEPSSDGTDTAASDPQTVGADWVVAYFSGGDWQQLTTPEARKTLSSARASYFDGKYLDGDKVNVSEWTWRDESTVSPQWQGTVDVLLQPGRASRLVASLRVTVDTTGSTPMVSKVETLFYGEA